MKAHAASMPKEARARTRAWDPAAVDVPVDATTPDPVALSVTNGARRHGAVAYDNASTGVPVSLFALKYGITLRSMRST